MNLVDTTQINVAETIIDFSIGQPDPDLLPLDIIQQASKHHFENNISPALLAYGAEPGSRQFRTLLADFLKHHYQTPVQADHILVTNGNSQGLDFMCTLFCQSGDTIFVEDPTYNLAIDIFTDHQLNVVGIPIDKEGLIIEALEEKLKRHRPKFIYTIPTFHNPSGVTLSGKRREKLVELSQKNKFLIVADEVYHLLSFNTTPPVPLGSFIRSETVISLGTFSKILAPGLRLGWIQAGSSIIKQLISTGLLKSGGGSNPFTSAIIGSVLELGLLDKYLDHIRKVYQQRSTTLHASLKEHLPDLNLPCESEGGYFYWLHFPDQINVQKLLKIAQQLEVNFKPGIDFSCSRKSENYARLCYAFYNEEKLITGVKRLAKAFTIFRKES
ncbi:MAG: PLP-dependent aminotransferase family protein [Deltaproteobacteria bacterium]|jgi:2-aminoadipate transaminase|nr:PLP-dependent aminotransferase family protein [Deltaproteobacteria bacterium]MBT4525568.1 PLP-dependent aminotransferase family protein [Deltaproteobacteria bacterium]